MGSLIPVNEARGDGYECIAGEIKYAKLFKEDEIERAETITNALKGMSIESAQRLLKKVEKYLLQSLLTD